MNWAEVDRRCLPPVVQEEQCVELGKEQGGDDGFQFYATQNRYICDICPYVVGFCKKNTVGCGTNPTVKDSTEGQRPLFTNSSLNF